ncbi:hypothetical protein FRC19_001765 [Serendipita sp. 401]|nr:hypothetical protein FRC19_001765 [Serendipita sp. 401]
MSFDALPPEVIFDVLEHLYQEQNAPIIGQKAAWTRMLPKPEESTESDERSNANTFYTNSEHSAGYLALLALRRTSRYLNDLCIPLIFRDYHLFTSHWHPVEGKLSILRTYAKHIRNIRLVANTPTAHTQEYEYIISNVLPLCTNATSLSLYYDQNLDILPMKESLALLKCGTIQSFGIYSMVILNQEVGNPTWEDKKPALAYELLNKLAQDTVLASNLRILDIVMETLPTKTYELIQTRALSLQSYTIRRAFRSTILDRIWVRHNRWMPNDNLTCLRLIDCSNAYAPHIPYLVQHFNSLRELMVSTCGDNDDVDPKTSRQNGWSKELGALCNVHRPLDTFHIENMIEWEMYELGVIPAVEVIVTLVNGEHLKSCLVRDAEIFPGVKVLHLGEVRGSTKDDHGGDNWYGLPLICQQMGIEIRRGAKWVRRRYYME